MGVGSGAGEGGIVGVHAARGVGARVFAAEEADVDAVSREPSNAAIRLLCVAQIGAARGSRSASAGAPGGGITVDDDSSPASGGGEQEQREQCKELAGAHDGARKQSPCRASRP